MAQNGEFGRNMKSGLALGLGIGSGLVIVFTAGLLAQNIFSFNSGDIVSSANINANFQTLIARDVPIGTIVAWHKDLAAGVPALPTNWKECDGSAVTDPASPLNGVSVPNLNGDARFLRGGAVSGALQASMYQDHSHYRNPDGFGEYLVTTLAGTVSLAPNPGGIFSPTTNLTGSAVGGNFGSETRPINMSVVWIIRIK